MATIYEVPLTASPQKVTVPMAGKAYQLKVVWNSEASCWVMDLADETGVPILNGVPIVTGADLLAQYAYLNFGCQLVAQTDNDANAVPTYANLGTDGHLYLVVS